MRKVSQQIFRCLVFWITMNGSMLWAEDGDDLDLDKAPPIEDSEKSNNNSDSQIPETDRSSNRSEKKEDTETAAEKALRFKNPPLVPISDQERKKSCSQHEKSFISFYDKVYYIKGCKKYLLTNDESSQITRGKSRPRDVESRVIASFEDGGDYAKMMRLAPNCKKFNKTYISFNLTTYFVDNCRYRKFPDEASYQEHRRKNKLIGRPILEPDGAEFATLKEGTPFPSVLDGETLDAGFIEVLSIESACRNVSGHYVSYLDSIYFVNRFKSGKGCWREKIDASTFSRKTMKGKVKLTELSSSQARSIPDYDPSAPQPRQ